MAVLRNEAVGATQLDTAGCLVQFVNQSVVSVAIARIPRPRQAPCLFPADRTFLCALIKPVLFHNAVAPSVAVPGSFGHCVFC